MEEAFEHGLAGQGVEPTLGGFGIVGLGAESLAGGAEPIEPAGVFGPELFFEFLAEALGKRGAFAVGGDGDLEIATLDDGAVVEVAVVDVVYGVAEDVAVVGFAVDLGVEIAKRGGCNDEEGAVEIGGLEGFGGPVDLAVADPLGQLGGELWGDYVDVGAGFEETRDFLCGDGTAAYDEDSAICEFQECGEEGH